MGSASIGGPAPSAPTAHRSDLCLTRLISMLAVGIEPTSELLLFAGTSTPTSAGRKDDPSTLTPGGVAMNTGSAVTFSPSCNWDRDELALP